MDAKEEQSHHGDEVMSSLCYKIKKRQKVKAGKKKEEERNTNRLHVTPAHDSYSKHLYLDHW